MSVAALVGWVKWTRVARPHYNLLSERGAECGVVRPPPALINGGDVIKTLTAKWLREHDACKRKTDLFEKLFPDGMEFTVKNVRRLYREIDGFSSADLWIVAAISCGYDCPATARIDDKRHTDMALEMTGIIDRSAQARIFIKWWKRWQK